ncbi:hypothetical protein GE061_015116 [Apolygus lucorum]|uniref:Potassium channel domain-containing protein n=1 Tax=Apolygus lucorum TaxID=248454 RepID=A0A8S9XL72_APOLU|nr:hypothetical protein GE061_015116 [Apolygus lucorum]
MADGGGDLGRTDGKNAEVRGEVVRKPSRRSPTTGHIRRRKTDLKRSQSSPREAVVPTSSDDEGRNVPVRRKSLSPGPGPEPKKVLRRRHRVKEKSQEPKDEASSLDSTKDLPKSGIIKKPSAIKDDKQQVDPKTGIIKKSSISEDDSLQSSKPKSGSIKKLATKVDNHQESKRGSIETPAATKSGDKETVLIPEFKEASPKKSVRKKSNGSSTAQPDLDDKNDAIQLTENSTKSEDINKSDAEMDKSCGDDSKTDKTTRPNSWWGGWSPFKRKEVKAVSEAEATSGDVDTQGEDYVTTDDETAAEFVKLLSAANKTEIKEVAVQPRKLSVDDENAPLLGKREKEEVKTWSQIIRESRVEFAKYKKEFPKEVATLKKLKNRCFCELLIMFIFCGCGALIFKTTEGSFESFYKCGVKRVKRDFIDDLWRSSHFMKEEDWKSKARSKLWMFENQLQEAFEAGINTYSGQKSWSFINGIIYCLTVVTTIGYGHIAPVTNSGRALTIAYSIIGIPLFLILLADFGKLFTRCIKFLWAFVRRLYYTGSCKKVRRTGPVQEVMKGVQMMYETIRRPSMFPQVPEGAEVGQEGLGTPGDPPSTPALSAFAIDDEFNLPISVAITILLVYIFMGATVFWCWEDDWSFFESFYFVFISMSTIGFGDLVPKNQMYMMLSIVYLAFGLALTSMCINVVQEKLSDSFRKASAKIGATIGLKVSDDDGTISPVSPTHVEIAEVHKSKSVQSMPVS